jgi:hypothetical protein
MPLPPGWGGKNGIQQSILIRDRRRCQWGSVPDDLAEYGQCSKTATEVDHIGDSEDHSYDNLRALCDSHHQLRSSRQGGAVKHRIAEQTKRPVEKHPGIIEVEDGNA